MIARLRPFIWISFALLLPYHVATSQKGNARVSGTVIDLTSGAAVASAEIIHLADSRVVLSDSLGHYTFLELPAGIVRFLVRGRGFPPTMVTVALTSGEVMSRILGLDSTIVGREAAQTLPTVAVEAEGVKPPTPRFVDFERRRRTGRGQYLVREEIEKSHFGSLQDAMRGLRGVNVECGGGRGCGIRMAKAPMRCSPDYIVDERLDNWFGPSTAIRDIEAIEVYTGPSDVPGEFAGRTAGCGVIVIWTRSGPSRRK